MSAVTVAPATAEACANIALVKYWGKADPERNVPAVGSLSLTLGGLTTVTEVAPAGGVSAPWTLDGRPMGAAEAARVQELLAAAGADPAALAFASSNHFPTAAGLASSAAGGAAAVMAVAAALDLDWGPERLATAALKFSGSAPRSLYGGFVRLDPDDERGCLVRALPMPAGWDLRVLVAQTARGPKDVGSREAMARSLASPYYRAWVDGHRADLDAAEAALVAGDFAALMTVTEASTLKMHALPLTSVPPVWYWRPTTLAVLEAVRGARAEGLQGGFTMDAGPHVKVLCRADEAPGWQARLNAVPGVEGVLVCAPGGPPAVTRDGRPWTP